MKKFVQFIAGAVCPECKSLDTIAINANDDEIYCIKCEFKEKRPTDNTKKSVDKINVINLEEFRKNRD
tara:strand:+ start:1493 stop:1696 length:204 start_codon:yes stop_codon:yes gene_type:complete